MALGSIGVAVGQNSRNAEIADKTNLIVALRANNYFPSSWLHPLVMHNRKKPDRARTAEEISAVQKKTWTYASLVSSLLERRRKRGNSAETLALIEKMLNNNPDFYTLYNFRREVLYDTYPQLTVCEEGNKYSAEDAK
jgi:hypothetical protein